MSDTWVRERLQRLATGGNVDEVVGEISRAIDQQQEQGAGNREVVRQTIRTVMREQQMATIESKLIRPPQQFDGSKDRWKAWSFSFESLIRMLKYHDTLKECETKRIRLFRSKIITTKRIAKESRVALGWPPVV